MVCMVKCTHEEAFQVWKRWAVTKIVQWKQGVGMSQVVGKVDGLPVNVSIFWNQVNGKYVGFWEIVSQAVDEGMAVKWLTETYPNRPLFNSFEAAFASGLLNA